MVCLTGQGNEASRTSANRRFVLISSAVSIKPQTLNRYSRQTLRVVSASKVLICTYQTKIIASDFLILKIVGGYIIGVLT
ncbi:unnamed protein product [Larinioides sclopetarius]|uniref:Uncharacterized protein n=1 Tax=Larinioides sclopetarius TaxID=280406 RepID=A0AAV1Z728_9ARAC